MTEFIDYSHSADLTERIGFRGWKNETSVHKHIGEIRMLTEFKSSLAMTGLAEAIKGHIRLSGYVTQEDVQALLDSQLDTLLGFTDNPEQLEIDGNPEV